MLRGEIPFSKTIPFPPDAAFDNGFPDLRRNIVKILPLSGKNEFKEHRQTSDLVLLQHTVGRFRLAYFVNGAFFGHLRQYRTDTRLAQLDNPSEVGSSCRPMFVVVREDRSLVFRLS